MKKHCVRILSAFFGLAALGAAARAQVSDQLIVKIPYEFVVAGKTLPAGIYRVNRVNDQDNRALLISSFENHAAVMIVPTEIVGTSGAEEPGLSFQQVGDQHILSKIETAEHVFTLSVSTPAARETAMKKSSGPSTSSSSGNN